jgi:beta-galactosidase
MKIKYKLLILFCLTSFLILTSAINNVQSTFRQEIDFNNNWKFKEGNIDDISLVNFNDTSWKNIHLPHDFSIFKTPYEEAPSQKDGSHYPMGIGNYRKVFNVPKDWQNKKVYIHFDGIAERGEVWINGTPFGMRPYAYAPYYYEISDALIAGKENLITVKTDNSNQPNARWYNGSGIYRDVKLVVTNLLHIKTWGTSITTPTVSNEKATIAIKTIVKNDHLETVNTITVNYAIKDKSGKIIASSEQKTEAILKATEKSFEQSLQVLEPKLWSPQSPYLYTLETTILKNGKKTDVTSETFGIREFIADTQNGLFLYGESIKLQGVCNHQDGGPVGTAVPKDVLRRRMQILKDMGCNAIRTSHNIASRDQIELADEMGFILIEEAFDGIAHAKRKFDYNIYFYKWWKEDLKNMINRDKNSPSIFMWSLGNELHKKSETTPIIKEMVSFVHQLDASRLVTCGNNFVFQADAVGISQELDVVGYNGGGGSFLDYEADKIAFPKRLMYGSEVPHTHSTRGYYQTRTEIRQINKARNKGTDINGKPNRVIKHPNLTEKEVWKKEKGYASSYDNCYNRVNMRDSWRRTRDLPYFMGEFRWTGFDYLGESGWPTRNGNYGIIDLVGFKKDAYYFYQSQWTEKPMVHILPHWTWKGKEGKKIPVWVYANADEVELILNGKSLGTKIMSSETMYCEWIVPYTPGKIEAKAYRNKKLVASTQHTTSTKLKELQLELDKKTITTSFDDVVHIKTKLIDISGEISPSTDQKVTYTISGPGTIIGVGNGDPMTKEAFKANTISTFRGLALCMVQSTGKTGTIKIEAKVANLPVAISTITVISK